MFNTDMFNTREYNESPNLTLSVSDSFSFSDSLSYVVAFFRTISDFFDFSDSFSRVWSGHLSISDTFSFSDSIISKVFNKLARAPKIMGAIFRQNMGGSALIDKPRRDI